jgi:hypothetical protein
MLKRERTMLRRTSGCEIAGSPTRGISVVPLLYMAVSAISTRRLALSACSCSSVSETHGRSSL